MNVETGHFTTPKEDLSLLEFMRSVVDLQSDALAILANSMNASFDKAVRLIAASSGKVILSGVGKSGLIAQKIAATFTSTGTPASYVHATDALHGDIGILQKDDVIILVGKSGDSTELVELIPVIRRIGAKMIAITAKKTSAIGQAADALLWTPVEKEACPLNLAPTVSTTLALVVGDALAVALMRLKGFKSDDFALTHPAGQLGKRLLLRVTDLMIPREKCPIILETTATMENTVAALTEYGLGIVLYMANEKLVGILTDGDIRRLVQQHRNDFFDLKVATVMNRKPLTIHGDLMAVDALKFMEGRSRPLNVVPIVDNNAFLGIVRLHDLLTLA